MNGEVMASKPNEIERSVEHRLTQLAQAWSKTSRSYSDRYCTGQVKVALGVEGKKNGCSVYAAAPGFRQHGEWLFDVTWLEVAGEHLLDFPLAAECEWTPGNETLWDFQKLLVSRATHRVLVMWAPTRRKADQAIDDLRQQVSRFRRSRRGDRYLFACYLGDMDKFVFKVYVVGGAT
jgi:hypothetical protein